MKSYRLSFGTIELLNNNLAEIIVDEGIILDEVMVDEYHDFLLNNLEAPFSLLVNKKNPYSYTFEAQKIIAHLDEIQSMAVLVNSIGGVMSTETLMNINGNIHQNIKIFNEREEAINWLADHNI
ncbi:hypothetical protein VOI54_00265 [Tamlana sp. 2201CG12-4]|uniref:hypothetical protein n=1 Tax=Tamlana sp. 2201CG12-4 TaxID=3112582 RepID=UPI002DBF827E|nr:hypothetical protein [Tamlana sp. 2201CG12-4]MEC3905440.1 hypothetical protein [Tamlana sp. 2201CG12-4]